MYAYLLYIVSASIIGLLLQYYKSIKRRNLKIVEYNELMSSPNNFSLYLRSFEDDGKSRPLPISLFTLTFKGNSYEEEIVNNFKMAQLIAVGRPNENLPELGAKRLYISNKTWKDKISRLVDRASIIIIKPNFSEGLLWEINLILKKGFLNKTIFYNHFKDENDPIAQKFYYNKFKNLLSTKFEICLLDYSPTMRFSYFLDDLTHQQVKYLKEVPLVKNMVQYQNHKG